MRKKLKIFSLIATITLVSGLIVLFNYYQKIYNSNVLADTAVYIPTNANIDQVSKILTDEIANMNSFLWVADKKKYPENIKAGKYLLKKGMNNNELVNLLRSGRQTAVKLSFNNQHTLESLAGRISQQIEPDSITLLQIFKDVHFLEKNGFNSNNALAMYIPNSYQIYWNTSAENFQNKMLQEYKRFWNNSRKAKAKAQNLSPLEVSALAAIVHKETSHIPERPIVAGLYLNRYHAKWPLQADPTVIFALKQKHGQDFEVKRVLNKDLKINSAYNTYLHKGIPPGPIAMPDISAIDAVLTPKKHRYFYMCASVEKIGTHAFASTISEHNKNAKKYQQWVTKQGIKR